MTFDWFDPLWLLFDWLRFPFDWLRFLFDWLRFVILNLKVSHEFLICLSKDYVIFPIGITRKNRNLTPVCEIEPIEYQSNPNRISIEYQSNNDWAKKMWIRLTFDQFGQSNPNHSIGFDWFRSIRQSNNSIDIPWWKGLIPEEF